MFASHADQQLVPVHLVLSSGECLKGAVVLGMTGKLADLLAKPQVFIEFEGNDGVRQFVSKAGIERVLPLDIPRADQLSRRIAAGEGFDPYAVLGIAPGASPAEITVAYRALAHRYHPDHFAGIDAPREVIDYVSAMFRRITMAYSEVKPVPRLLAAEPA